MLYTHDVRSLGSNDVRGGQAFGAHADVRKCSQHARTGNLFVYLN